MSANLLPQRAIITLFFLLFALGSIVLFWQNNKERDPSYHKNWWSLAFIEPGENKSLDFRVENYTGSEAFSYQIKNDQGAFEEETLSIPQGRAADITVAGQGPATIEVIHGSEKKSIYRR